jgi:hypothetical protein
VEVQGKQEMSVPAEAGQPREHRQRVLKGASILLGIKNSEINCTIRNMNKDGAELRVAAEARVPKEFLLYVPNDGVAYRAVLRWRKQDRCGVMFTGTEPKPHWHYG